MALVRRARAERHLLPGDGPTHPRSLRQTPCFRTLVRAGSNRIWGPDALAGVDRLEFLDAGYIPPSLENTLVSEEDFAQGQPVLPLSPENDQIYQDE
jgi:hypothetical protein